MERDNLIAFEIGQFGIERRWWNMRCLIYCSKFLLVGSKL